MSETETAPAPVEVVDGAQQTATEYADRARETATHVAERVGETAERVSAATGRIASDLVERMRNNAELAADRGTTTIANEVVEKIAAIAAREVPGVYDLGGDVARLFASVKERIGLGRDGGESADQGVKVRLDGRQAAVTITLVIEYGFVVHSVTDAVRTKVIGAVENLLGLEVTTCDIVVDDVHVPDSGPVGDDEARAADYR
ncbi:hypothetical protein GCM10009682_31350 [Luedemannella flava]|uniref:Asp23/Gls24 family envelope stress response protein n=1 Tax=Luedemannella flava TaxID=349316 RepID=A0ABP4Y8K1_9ACTN